MSQLDFADPVLSYHPTQPPQPTTTTTTTTTTSTEAAEAYAAPANHPVHDLLSLLKGAFNAVLDLAPALVSQPTQTSTTTTVTTITSSAAGSAQAFTTLTTTTTTMMSTSVVPLGPSDHGQRSCVDFIRRLLGAGGATELRINSLPVRSLCVEDGLDKLAFGQDTCAICLDGYECDNRVRVLGCEHVFHTGCIDPWLRRGRPTCPLCQTICC